MFELKCTPFHERTSKLCLPQNWRRWAGYLVAGSYELTLDREYWAIRNAAALIDVTPLMKYIIRGKDACRMLNRVVTRDMDKLKVGQVYYTGWCDDEGKLLDDDGVRQAIQQATGRTVVRLAGADRYATAAALTKILERMYRETRHREPFLASRAELAQSYGFKIDPDAVLEDLSVGQQQRVEILKALYRGVEVLILDEPTAVLTPNETEELFENLRSLRTDGKSIIFISHKLNEVLRIADRITVLRRGKVVGETTPSQNFLPCSYWRIFISSPIACPITFWNTEAWSLRCENVARIRSKEGITSLPIASMT